MVTLLNIDFNYHGNTALQPIKKSKIQCRGIHVATGGWGGGAYAPHKCPMPSCAPHKNHAQCETNWTKENVSPMHGKARPPVPPPLHWKKPRYATDSMVVAIHSKVNIEEKFDIMGPRC